MATALRPIGHEDHLTLVEHLDELRTRLLICLAAFVVAFSFCYWQDDRILEIANGPLEEKVTDVQSRAGGDPLEQAFSYQRRTAEAAQATASFYEALAVDPGLSRESRRRAADTAEKWEAAARAAPRKAPTGIVTLGVGEPFFTTLTVAGYGALLLSLPLILYQLYAFILPAFSPHERRVALPLMAAVPVLFLIGVVFGFLIVLPRAVDFLQNFNDDAFDILVQARDYYRFTILLLVAMGILFQIPVGVLAITRMGVLTVAQLRKGRGYAILAIAVLAAVATPDPSPFTMLLAMGPLVVLFEASILLAAALERRRDARGDDDRADADDEPED